MRESLKRWRKSVFNTPCSTLSKYFRTSIFKYQLSGRQKCTCASNRRINALFSSAGVAVVDLIGFEVAFQDVHDRMVCHALAERRGADHSLFGIVDHEPAIWPPTDRAGQQFLRKASHLGVEVGRKLRTSAFARFPLEAFQNASRKLSALAICSIRFPARFIRGAFPFVYGSQERRSKFFRLGVAEPLDLL